MFQQMFTLNASFCATLRSSKSEWFSMGVRMNRLFLVIGNWHLGTLLRQPPVFPRWQCGNFRIFALRWLAPVFPHFLCHFSGTPRASRPPFSPTQRHAPVFPRSTSAAIFSILPFVPQKKDMVSHALLPLLLCPSESLRYAFIFTLPPTDPA
jgi:hypothetical protein